VHTVGYIWEQVLQKAVTFSAFSMAVLFKLSLTKIKMTINQKEIIESTLTQIITKKSKIK